MNAQRYVVRCVEDAFWVGPKARDYARSLGFSSKSTAEIAIICAELVTNAVKYAGGGILTLSWLDTAKPPTLEFVMEDEGPGFASAEHVLEDGYSEGRFLGPDDVIVRRGLGSGLAAVLRLSNEVRILNRDPQGACVIVRKRIL